jgi:hypothetical protein
VAFPSDRDHPDDGVLPAGRHAATIRHRIFGDAGEILSGIASYCLTEAIDLDSANTSSVAPLRSHGPSDLESDFGADYNRDLVIGCGVWTNRMENYLYYVFLGWRNIACHSHSPNLQILFPKTFVLVTDFGRIC